MHRSRAAFHLIAKPAGPRCNLDCGYCFYLPKIDELGTGTGYRMTDEVLETYVRAYLDAHPGPEVTFAWQGGEPTLMPVDFYRRAMQLQEQHCPPGTQVVNAFQTNGTLLDDEWCRFLAEAGFLVGLSVDGPPALHDAHRLDKRGRPTSDRVGAALQMLHRYGVEVNVLCTINHLNAGAPVDVYRHLVDNGADFLQFIPAVGLDRDGALRDWTVRPQEWGDFLCGVFDIWVAQDVGRVHIQAFEEALGVVLGHEPSLCVHARTCGSALAVEHNGDVYSCDHYVTPAYRLGNLTETPLDELVTSPAQERFARNKIETLPDQCLRCDVRAVCNGGCPKDRFAKTADGRANLNYLCDGYRAFFTHALPPLTLIARLVRHGRPASDVMALRAEVARPVS